jgi:transcriptional regulator with XRE-family HTH domain
MAKPSEKVAHNGPGRPQESARTGPGYQLAEYINKEWDKRATLTNMQAADAMGLRSHNIVSMWKTGRTKISLEKLPWIARTMKVDLAFLLPMWMEQNAGESPESMAEIEATFKRLAMIDEWPILKAIRKALSQTGKEITTKQIAAIEAIIKDESLADKIV